MKSYEKSKNYQNGVRFETAIWQCVSRLPYGSTFRDCHRVVPKWQKTIGFYDKNGKIEGGHLEAISWGATRTEPVVAMNGKLRKV